MGKLKLAQPAAQIRKPALGSGGWSGSNLGIRYSSYLQAVNLVSEGLAFSSLAKFQKSSGLSLDRIKQVVRISEGAFARRKESGRLSPDESERLLRLGRILERTTLLYDGDKAGAREWLETPIPALGNQKPLDLVQSEPGAREVEELMERIARGVVS